jgi:hypothetical protein
VKGKKRGEGLGARLERKKKGKSGKSVIGFVFTLHSFTPSLIHSFTHSLI